MPHWDPVRQELRLGEVVVKQFKVPAANQERVLAAFQEEGWPRRIDDPLPPSPDLDPKRRLHETISSLNRNLLRPWIHFHGDGTGQGIRWRLLIPGETATSSDADGQRPSGAAEPPPRLFRPHGEYGRRKTEVRTNRRRNG